MSARPVFILCFSVLLGMPAAAQKTLTVEGAEDTQQEYTLEGASLVEILTSGNVLARVSDDVSCEEFEACDSCCEPCDECEPCDCDTQLQFNQFTISSGGSSAGAGGQLTITQGDPVLVRWQTPGAFTCTGSGLSGTAWNGNQPTFSALASAAGVSVGTGALAPSASPFTLLLSCENASRQEQRQVTLDVEAPSDPTPQECLGVPSLEQASGGALVRGNDVIIDFEADGFSFEAIFGSSFPGTQGSQRRVRHFPDTYASMRFRTPSDLNATHFGLFPKDGFVGTNGGPAIMSYSRCQGDFDINSVETGCYRKVEGLENLRWSGDPASPFCSLEPDTEYYFNIVYTVDSSGTPPSQIQWSCGGDDSLTRCGHIYVPNHNYP